MGRTVEELEETMTAIELMRWMAFYAVRQEKADEARRAAADGDMDGDDEIHHWGDEPDGEDDEQ